MTDFSHSSHRKFLSTGVQLSKWTKWDSARDNVTIGATEGIDGSQWQMLIPHLTGESITTNDQNVPMYGLALSRGQKLLVGVQDSKPGLPVVLTPNI